MADLGTKSECDNIPSECPLKPGHLNVCTKKGGCKQALQRGAALPCEDENIGHPYSGWCLSLEGPSGPTYAKNPILGEPGDTPRVVRRKSHLGPCDMNNNQKRFYREVWRMNQFTQLGQPGDDYVYGFPFIMHWDGTYSYVLRNR